MHACMVIQIRPGVKSRGIVYQCIVLVDGDGSGPWPAQEGTLRHNREQHHMMWQVTAVISLMHSSI